MGKSSHSQDRGVPKRNVRDDDDIEEFDWREALRKVEEEKKKGEAEEITEAQLEKGDTDGSIEE